MEKVELKADLANLSEEQFFLLCARNKRLRIERDKNSNIIIMAPTGSDTGNINGEIFGEVRNWNKETKLGFTFDSNSGFTMPNSAMRSPDVSWIPKEKYESLSKEDRKRFAHICPDFVIELLSESDSIKDTMAKMEEWLENGCLLGWLIDPESRTTHIYKPNQKPITKQFSETLSGETILPGFELILDTII
jgi:Uma2 family endonuclease